MPSSRPETIPTIIRMVKALKPRSILDVGVGFGKWGHLFREYTDINAAEHDPGRYARENWEIRIDGIEGYPGYLTPMHEFIYDHIYVGDALAVMPELPTYDLIFLGDIIEHFAAEDGHRLLEGMIGKAGQAVLVSTPKCDTLQGDSCGNPLERHRSVWAAGDFEAYAGARVRTIGSDTLLALILKPGVPDPGFDPSKPVDAPAFAPMITALDELIERDTPFILVDEQQLVTSLHHSQVVPFLEREGAYWGPPADDEEAIENLEQLRGKGAHYIVFIWTTFWWLERFPRFARHLRSRYPCIEQTSDLVIHQLNPQAICPPG